MRRFLNRSAFCALALSATPIVTPAHAALETGAKAPDFTTPASLGGKEFSFHLADALKTGPVVLYFYPAAFTSGCTIEAHDFAEAIPDFKAAGATVIGISMDPIAKLDKFSVSECRSAFAVAADPSGRVTTQYRSKMPLLHMASRTSYVIAPDRRIVMAYSSMSPDDHVARTLAAVKALQTKAH